MAGRSASPVPAGTRVALLRGVIEVSAGIDIAAPADAIWETLIDLHRFRDWNPFIRRASGSLRVGRQVRLRVRTRFGLPLIFRATVTVREAPRELRWRGYFLAPWLASGDHTFTLEPSAGGTVHLEQREAFSGILPKLGRALLVRETRLGFDAMNRAVKRRAEAR